MLAESLWAFVDIKSRKRRATSVANHSSGRMEGTLLTGSRRRFFRAKAEISRTRARLLFPSRVRSRAPQKLNRIRKYPSERKLARGWGFMLALYRQETIILHLFGFKIIPPPPPRWFLSPLYWKTRRARVAKREQEPAVAHDALRLISLKNTLDTKTIWENMYSVIEKAAVIEKRSVYFFIVVVIIIIIFIFYYFFFTELLSQKILRN